MSTSKNSLVSAVKLKLERAEHHILDLKRQITDYMVEADIHLVDRINHKAHERVLSIEKKIPIPDVFSLIIGDVAHNLCSCLDIATYIVLSPHVEAIDPKGLDYISFPFARSEETFKATLLSARIKLAGKDVFRAFKASRAYPGGNDDLCALRRLNIIDKHRLIVATAHAATLTSRDLGIIDPDFVTAADDPNEVTQFIGTDTICRVKYKYRNRQERLAMERVPATQKKANWQPPFEICFGEGEPFEGQNLFAALARCTKEVGVTCLRIIDAVEPQGAPPAANGG